MMQSRRYDLDWLRVMALGLLIFYHIGMFFVSWDFHVKSVHAGPSGESLMKLVNPWRLPLLFFISGAALRFALDKRTPAQLGLTRGLRLFIPILFAIHVIVAPQSWLQLLENGEINSGFWAFYPDYLIGSIDNYSIIIPTWNHLWYVVYLLVYTLILLPFAHPLTKLSVKMDRLFSGKLGVITVIALPIVPFLIFRLWLKPLFPSTHALFDDWANHQLYLSIYILGFLFAKVSTFWQAVSGALKPTAVLVITIASVALLVWYGEGQNISSAYFDSLERYSELVRKTAYAWLSILLLLGISQRWFNRSNSLLEYMNEAIFPWYILHQTLIVMAGYWLTRQNLSLSTEFIGLCFITIGGCWLIHECFIRRWQWIRPLFGLKRCRR